MRENGAISWEEKANPFDLETLMSSIQCQKAYICLGCQ